MIILDELDKSLLRHCKEKSGSQLSVIIEPFLELRTRSVLYDRLKRLESAGLIEVDKTTYRGSALCHITTDGEKALGTDEPTPREERETHGFQG